MTIVRELVAKVMLKFTPGRGTAGKGEMDRMGNKLPCPLRYIYPIGETLPKVLYRYYISGQKLMEGSGKVM